MTCPSYQKEISKVLNISQVAYSYYEINKRNIPLELLSKLADYYNTSVDYLLYRTNIVEPYPKNGFHNNISKIQKKNFQYK